jgi:hypothetical protein
MICRLFGATLASVAVVFASTQHPIVTAAPAESPADLGRSVFVENRGLTDPAVRFVARGPASIPVFFTEREVRFVLSRDGERAAVGLELVGAAPSRIDGRVPTHTTVTHIGDTRRRPHRAIAK